MDIVLSSTSVYRLPSSHRVGAIAHDGTADLRLWPGPSQDRELLDAYGSELRGVLDAERKKLEGERLPFGGVLRMHPGRLHCDMLLWLALRHPEPGVDRSPAPNEEALRDAIASALDFVSGRGVLRVAFPALGGGPGELAVAERLTIIARAANAWSEGRFASGRSTVIEEVLVCEPHAAAIATARARLAGVAKTLGPAPAVRPSDSETQRARRPASGSRSGASAGASKPRGRARLDPDELARARVMAAPYDRARTYSPGDWFVHPRFGPGRVEQTTAEGAIVVLFEDGEQRKMIHARP